MKTWQIDAKDLRRHAPMLRAGDHVLLSGEIYTARDAAHKRMMASLNAGKALPFPLEGACIYFAGPTAGRYGNRILRADHIRPYGPLYPDSYGLRFGRDHR